MLITCRTMALIPNCRESLTHRAFDGARKPAQKYETVQEDVGPSIQNFGKRAAEAHALGRHALIAVRGWAQVDDLKALNGIIVGAETLGSDLMHARMILQGKSHAVGI